MSKTGFKIFMGTRNFPADDMMNEWLDKHPEIKVIDFKYQQARYGEHSICVMYEVK